MYLSCKISCCMFLLNEYNVCIILYWFDGGLTGQFIDVCTYTLSHQLDGLNYMPHDMDHLYRAIYWLCIFCNDECCSAWYTYNAGGHATANKSYCHSSLTEKANVWQCQYGLNGMTIQDTFDAEPESTPTNFCISRSCTTSSHHLNGCHYSAA